jgi:putative transposase
MTERDHPFLTMKDQCDLLSLPRSTLYYKNVPTSETNELIMRVTDRIFTANPYYGYRRMTVVLNRLLDTPGDMKLIRDEDLVAWPFTPDNPINPKRTRRLYRVMGIEASYPKPDLSKPRPNFSKIYPYLLRGLNIDHPNMVWAVDITYIPLLQGHMYLYAVEDLYSRFVLSHSLSNTMEVGFCTDCLKKAVERFTAPEIHNSDQGSQFTSDEYLGYLEGQGIRPSLDGRGRALDNVFVERLWRSLKYEEVYMNCYADGEEARTGISRYFKRYNESRPHMSLKATTAGNGKTLLTPAEAYFGATGKTRSLP